MVPQDGHTCSRNRIVTHLKDSDSEQCEKENEKSFNDQTQFRGLLYECGLLNDIDLNDDNVYLLLLQRDKSQLLLLPTTSKKCEIQPSIHLILLGSNVSSKHLLDRWSPVYLL